MKRAFLLVLLLMWPSKGFGAADWPMYRHDAQRSGYTPEKLPAKLSLLWTYRTRHAPQPAWPRSNRMPLDRAYQPVVAGGLVFVAVYSWTRMLERPGDQVWLEAGLQAANGITTLALTYTLLGISLGVGSLAENELSQDTVQTVIRNLTAQFSMAFLTTVVGLPTSAVLRTVLVLTHARSEQSRDPTTQARIAQGQKEGV